MNDSSLFLQWAVNTPQHHHSPGVLAEDGAGAFPSVRVLLREASQAAAVVLEPTELAEATKSSTSGTGGGGESGCVWSMSPSSGVTCVPRSIPPVSWNFGAVSTPPSGTLDVTPAVAATAQEMVQPTRRASASARSAAGTGPASAAYAQGHIMAERKRREKISQRFIQLSAVIPGLNKMDKATILTDAVRHVKELQERVKALEAAAGASNIQTVVLVKKSCVVAPARSLASPGRSPLLPEIEAKLSGNNVMVRIHCENGKGLVVRALAQAEELHLRIVHSNVMPFTASTLIMTIMAKVQEGFNVKADEIVGSLSSALHQHSDGSSGSSHN